MSVAVGLKGRGWKARKRERLQAGAVERVRELVWNTQFEHGMHFHEIAMADPFEAETLFTKLCDDILVELGHPKTVKIWDPPQ